MYIPLPRHGTLDSAAPRSPGNAADRHVDGSWAELFMAPGRPALTALGDGDGRETVKGILELLTKRQFSSNPTTNTNAQIGLIVGLTLTAFVVGVGIFLYMYRGSIRFSFKKRGRRRWSTGGGSSKSVKYFEGEPPPGPASAEKPAE